MDNKKIEIDLVYLWVDGNDPKWQEKKQVFTGKVSDTSEENNIGRYVSHDELKYSLRSAEKHAPWIRKIYIVTDDQKPEWVNINHPKIQLVDHKEIMPAEILPCFNAMVIEYFLHKIPDLSEYFLFANDDMFFNADLSPNYFFSEDGYPNVRLKRKLFGKWRYRWKSMMGKDLGQYRNQIVEASLLVEKKFGKYYSGVPHHNIDSYRKSDYQKAVEVVFSEEAKKSQSHRIRAFGTLQRSAFSYYALAIGHAHLKYAGQKESGRILIYKQKFAEYLNRHHSSLFCLNDDQNVTHEHRKQVEPFLESLFPMKSAFEK